jgi:hypothetical protein
MIRHITSVLNETVLALPVGLRVPFAEVIDGVPSERVGRDQFKPIITDANGGVSYWRANGAQSVSQLDRTAACGDAVRVAIPMALIAFVRREQCDAPDQLLNAAAHQLRASTKVVRNSIAGAFGVSIGGITLGTDTVRSSEVQEAVVPTSMVVLALTCVIYVDASADCLDQCGEPYDLVCAVIGGASNAKVAECLGGRLDEICDGGGPCDPTTVNGTESDTPTITVLQGGVEVGTLNPATGVHTVPECDEPCLVDAFIYVDGELVEVQNNLDPCEAQTININISW